MPCLATPAGAQPPDDLPLWEIGAGIGAATLPDYPGSDQTDNFVLPVPYFIYRGEVFKADRDGMRAKFLGGPRIEFDLSLGATPPVSSQESDARQGMPDIKAAIEVGPEVRIHLADDGEDVYRRRYDLNLHLPVRHSMSWTHGHPLDIGNIAYPHLNWKQTINWMDRDWKIDADLGAYFNDRSYHQYFYQVLPRYATASRPAYTAHGGFGGWEASVFSSRGFDRLRVTGFVQIGSVGGAAFEDSPLVRRSFSLTAGLAVNYVFWISPETVASASDSQTTSPRP